MLIRMCLQWKSSSQTVPRPTSSCGVSSFSSSRFLDWSSTGYSPTESRTWAVVDMRLSLRWDEWKPFKAVGRAGTKRWMLRWLALENGELFIWVSGLIGTCMDVYIVSAGVYWNLWKEWIAGVDLGRQ